MSINVHGIKLNLLVENGENHVFRKFNVTIVNDVDIREVFFRRICDG